MTLCGLCGQPKYPVAINRDLSLIRACGECDSVGLWPRLSSPKPYDWASDPGYNNGADQ